ncbi:DNA mismatch repair protein MutS [Candidatus Peregrinibacteria bacterium]|nr:DNA mismatch repair protein MutS [Candidatus Peregrinibacteria bacterium]
MGTLTPMMAQYKKIKEQYQDCILMFRLGDFYEMFFEDALEASRILQITLTARGKGGENETPMCGIPYHALDGYLYKLTKARKKVAICDQMTAPDGKGIVERDVTKVVTPGTTFNENILETKANNYVAAIFCDGKKFALAYCDITTGEFKVSEFLSRKDLEAEITKIAPAECIGEESFLQEFAVFFKSMEICRFPFLYRLDAEKELKNHFQIQNLQSFGLENKPFAVYCCGMLFEYLKQTQKSDLQHIQKIVFYEASEFMRLDEALIFNLELFFTGREGKREGSLIWVLDQTVTCMGGRLIRNWLKNPLLNLEAISERQRKVEFFVRDSNLLREMRETLQGLYDIERLLGRLSLGSGNARDLIAMKESLKKIPEIKNLANELGENLCVFENLVDLIEKAIDENAPLSVRDGNMIRGGYNDELDELRSLLSEGKTFIKNMQEREIKRTGISSLKVKFNKVFGYYIEISKANLDAVPSDYFRKQTLVNAERFITPELKEYEEKVLHAEEKIRELEYELFYQVRMEVIKEILQIQQTAKALAEIDVFSNFAFIAEKFGYCKPEISETGEVEIIEGRHPVIERIVSDFVPNDCIFEDTRKFLLITGPNMGGKSTYLRQVALICLMAQLGSFVPAKTAKLSVVDRIFTRVGASDNLSRGQSTFMVEMQEAAYILNQATSQSLIILDEIGRGTSTYDGVSIAWAIMEYLHDRVGAKTLFATHYHELIELAEGLKEAVNLSVLVRETGAEGVVFLYRVVEGAVDKSYGIEVAKLAGLPVDVVGRARGVLRELETKHIKKSAVSPDQTSIFERESKGLSAGQKLLFEDLNAVNIDKMTPLEALKKLSDMKARSKK